MKRYNYNVYIDGEVEFVEHPDGEWVKNDDVVELLLSIRSFIWQILKGDK